MGLNNWDKKIKNGCIDTGRAKNPGASQFTEINAVEIPVRH